MNQVQFLTDSMAGLIASALLSEGLELPVYGQVNDPVAEHDRLEVRCTGVDEIIPGNYTMRVDCEAVLHMGAGVNDAGEVEAAAAAVGAAVRSVLMRDWKNKPLPWPDALIDEQERAEYELMPFVVLDIVAEPQAAEVGGSQYEWATGFRVYVQF